MSIDHVEVVPAKAGFDLKLFTDPQRSFGMTDLTQEDLIRIARDIHNYLGIRTWMVTVKLPKDPNRPHALSCRHIKKNQTDFDWSGHCGQMSCDNYLSKCPRHSLSGSEEARCNREKVTAACPWSPYCTDQTGEHHTFLVYATTDSQAKEHAEHEMEARGFPVHVTRIEVVG